jgi:hypothetical protein
MQYARQLQLELLSTLASDAPLAERLSRTGATLVKLQESDVSPETFSLCSALMADLAGGRDIPTNCALMNPSERRACAASLVELIQAM